MSEKISPEELRDYLQSHMEWAIAEFGRENVLYVLRRCEEKIDLRKECGM